MDDLTLIAVSIAVAAIVISIITITAKIARHVERSRWERALNNRLEWIWRFEKIKQEDYAHAVIELIYAVSMPGRGWSKSLINADVKHLPKRWSDGAPRK